MFQIGYRNWVVLGWQLELADIGAALLFHMSIQELAANLYDLAHTQEKDAALLSMEAMLIQKIANRTCERCEKPFNYGHARQRYCCDDCRVAAWEGRTGVRVNKRKSEVGDTGRVMGTSITDAQATCRAAAQKQRKG